MRVLPRVCISSLAAIEEQKDAAERALRAANQEKDRTVEELQLTEKALSSELQRASEAACGARGALVKLRGVLQPNTASTRARQHAPSTIAR